MEDAATRFTRWYAQERKECGMRVTSKDKEFKWVWLAIHWFFMLVTFGKQNKFYNGFITTIGRTVYFPEGWTINNARIFDCITLRHEAYHIKVNIKWGFGNATLGTILAGIAYLFLPLPIGFAWFRYKMEREAYRISYYTAIKLGLQPNTESYVELLTGPKYLWAWYSKRQVRAWFRNNCRMQL